MIPADPGHSRVLAVDAWVEHQWGFLLLETVWAAVSWLGVARKARGQPAPAAH